MKRRFPGHAEFGTWRVKVHERLKLAQSSPEIASSRGTTKPRRDNRTGVKTGSEGSEHRGVVRGQARRARTRSISRSGRPTTAHRPAWPAVSVPSLIETAVGIDRESETETRAHSLRGTKLLLDEIRRAIPRDLTRDRQRSANRPA